MPGFTSPRTEPKFKPNRHEQLEVILECESDRDLIMEILINKYPELLHVDSSHGKKDLITIPPDGLRVGDEEYFGLATKPWRALELLCVSHNYTASMGNLAERVWDDHEKIPTLNMRNDLRSRLNDYFREKKIDWHVEGNDAYLSIRKGPPRPKKSFDDSHQIPTRSGRLTEMAGAKNENQ